MRRSHTLLGLCLSAAAGLYALRLFEGEAEEMVNESLLKEILMKVLGIRISFLVINHKQGFVESILLLLSFAWLCYETISVAGSPMAALLVQVWVTLGIKVSSHLLKILDGGVFLAFTILYPLVLAICARFWSEFWVIGLVALMNFVLDLATVYNHGAELSTKSALQISSEIDRDTFDLKIPLMEGFPLSELWKVDMNAHIAHLNPLHWDKSKLIDENEQERLCLMLSFASEEERDAALEYMQSKVGPLADASPVSTCEKQAILLQQTYPHVSRTPLEICLQLSQANIQDTFLIKHDAHKSTLVEYHKAVDRASKPEDKEIHLCRCVPIRHEDGQLGVLVTDQFGSEHPSIGDLRWGLIMDDAFAMKEFSCSQNCVSPFHVPLRTWDCPPLVLIHLPKMPPRVTSIGFHISRTLSVVTTVPDIEHVLASYCQVQVL